MDGENILCHEENKTTLKARELACFHKLLPFMPSHNNQLICNANRQQLKNTANSRKAERRELKHIWF